MADRLAPSVVLPMEHLLTSLVFLSSAMIMIICKPAILTDYHTNQYAIAVTHAVVLGWIMTTFMGALYQMVPIVLETRLYSEKIGHLALLFHIPGVIAMVFFFWRWNIKGVAFGSSLFILGQVLFLINMSLTLWRNRPWDVISGSMAASILWLFMTLVFGGLLVASKLGYFRVSNPIAWMHAHAHAGLAGCFIGLIMGISFRILPLFLLSEIQSWNRAANSLWLFHLGLLISVATMMQAHALKLAGNLIALWGIVLFLYEIMQIHRAKKRKQTDWAMIHLLGGLGLLLPTILAGTYLSLPHAFDDAFSMRLETVYGFICIFGVVGMGVMGMKYKILSFLTWYACYAKKIGECEVPPLSAMVSVTLQKASFFIYTFGCLWMCIGIGLGNEKLIGAAGITITVGVALFQINIGKILSHFLI